MVRSRISVFSGIVAAVAATAGLAGAAQVKTVYDFETDSAGNKIKWGQVIDNEYAAQGLTISVSNPKYRHLKVRQQAVIADTIRTPVNDMKGTTWKGWHPGNAIIIPDNSKDSDKDGYFDRPVFVDSYKPGFSGTFFFDFNYKLEKVSLFMIDVDEDETGGTITGFLNGKQVAQSMIVPRDGHRSGWHHLTGSAFDKVVVTLGGSAAIGEIHATSVPTPSAAVAGLAMLGAALLRRRSAA